MNKPTATIRDVYIVPASQVFQNQKDGFIALGVCVSDERQRGFIVGQNIRTSLIVSFDPKTGVIETMNTLYKIV